MGFTSSESAVNMSAVSIDAMLQRGDGSVALPPLRSEAFISQRHEVNPALALNLLKDIQLVVTTWQEQLRLVVQAMHVLYAQGPMVDGWLESSLTEMGTANESAIFRHGDADALMQYVEALELVGQAHACDQARADDYADSSSAAGYRLCSLDESGNVRSQPCSLEQMATVSTAIARYQKFKQLIDQKQCLEAKLQRAVDELTTVRAGLTLPSASV